MNCRFSED